ncbi:MAG: hypothetical protein M5R37_02240 [Melioribacteraceae bacterium]|nr:hypothetical protein [Melioribacteraceae bacterium]
MSTHGGNGKHTSNGSNGNTTSFDPMTDPQKRLLFRLLSHDKLEGDQAHKKLLELFSVKSLSEVSKRDASSMIEQLLEKRN